METTPEDRLETLQNSLEARQREQAALRRYEAMWRMREAEQEAAMITREATRQSAKVRRHSTEVRRQALEPAIRRADSVLRTYATMSQATQPTEESLNSWDATPQTPEPAPHSAGAVLRRYEAILQSREHDPEEGLTITGAMGQSAQGFGRSLEAEPETARWYLEAGQGAEQTWVESVEAPSRGLLFSRDATLDDETCDLDDTAANRPLTPTPHNPQPPAAREEKFLECPICLDPLTIADEAAIATCGHMFHNKSDCLQKLVSLGSAKCPICREPIVKTIPVYNGIPSSTTVIQER